MSLLVKICGLRCEADVEAALAAGADAVGFVFHAPSPRDVTPARAAALARALPAQVLRVAVTLHPTPAQVRGILSEFAPSAWQTDLEDFASIELPAAIARWPVLRSGAAAPAALPATILYDAPVSGRGQRGDWAAAARLARHSRLVLAGGLDEGTVARAIAEVRPAGVDVSSGVESRPGVKDGARIRRFVAAARAASQRLAS